MEAKAASGVLAAQRLEEMRAYVLARVSAQARAHRERGERLTRDTAARLAQSILRETFQIFEDYIQ